MEIPESKSPFNHQNIPATIFHYIYALVQFLKGTTLSDYGEFFFEGD